jgi:radical SAM protein with 4Fe4S-binding SPASM domain
MLCLSLPAIYTLELTPICNNRCPGCSNVYAAYRPPATKTAEDWAELLAGILPETVQVRLSGGEPTLHPEFFAILDNVLSYGVDVTVFTNGRWPNPEWFVQSLSQHRDRVGLLISLHGATPTSHEAFTRVAGSFQETVDNVRLATENHTAVMLSTIITHHSWNEIEAVVALAQDLGAQGVAFNRYLGASLPGIEPTLDEMRIALQTIQNLPSTDIRAKYGIGIPQCFAINNSEGCLAGVAYVTIDPWGNVRPCNHSPTVVGSLHEHSIRDLWHSNAMNAWRALMPDKCTTCAAYSICHGGCRAVQELRADGRDPLRSEPLTEYAPAQEIKELPANVRPHRNFRIREEDFGYALLGQGHVLPVACEAWHVVNACDGTMSFAELAAQFGQPGLDLLGELWELGMLDAA